MEVGAGKGCAKANFAAATQVIAHRRSSTKWMCRERSEESFTAVGD